MRINDSCLDEMIQRIGSRAEYNRGSESCKIKQKILNDLSPAK